MTHDGSQDPQVGEPFRPIPVVSTSGPGLKPDAVHFFGLLANSVGFDAPEVNSIATMAVVIAFVGLAAPSAFIVTVIGGLSFAVVIARFSRVAPSAAGLQEFIRRGLGDVAGDFGAVAYVMGMGVFIAGAGTLAATTVPALLQSWFPGSHGYLLSHWFAWLVVVILLCATLAYLGVEISSRVLLFGIVVILATYGLLAIAALRYEWQARASRPGAVTMIWAFLPGLVMLGFCAICLYSQIHPAPPPPYNQAPFAAIGWLAVAALAATWWKVRAVRNARTFGDAR